MNTATTTLAAFNQLTLAEKVATWQTAFETGIGAPYGPLEITASITINAQQQEIIRLQEYIRNQQNGNE